MGIDNKMKKQKIIMMLRVKDGIFLVNNWLENIENN